jgi:amidase
MVKANWELQAEICQKALQSSMNPEWLLAPEELPPSDLLNVIPFLETCKRLSPRELEITKTDAVDLVAQMAAGTLTAVETATAFLKRAHIGQQLLNFATEFMVEDALARAAELDAHFKETGKLVGPLHGVPISVKEHIGLQGRVSHATYVALTDNVCKEDALIVKSLKAAGAVFHVRTNQPQLLMVFLCRPSIIASRRTNSSLAH